MSCAPHLRSTIHRTIAYITCSHRLVDHLTQLRIFGRSEATRNRPSARVRPQLLQGAEAGQVAPSLDRTYPLEEVPHAMQQLETGQVRGNVAITPGG